MNADPTDLERQLRGTLARTAERVPEAPRPTLSWERSADAPQGVASMHRLSRSRTRRVLQVATPLTVAAAVAAAAVVVLPGQNPPSGPPAPVLEEVALLTPGGTMPMEPGQFLYSRITYQGDAVTSVDEYWVPQDATQVWTYRATVYDRVTGEPVAPRYDPTTGEPIEGPHVETAPCGHFAHPEETSCSDAGSWQNPTPRFLANLPTDPTELGALLVEWGDNWTRLAMGDDYPMVFGSAEDQERGRLYEPMYAANYLAAGTVGMSQPFSQALEQAIASLPGVVAEPATNPAGVPGSGYTAVTSSGEVAYPALIFDADGNYIGTPTSSVVVGAAEEAGVAPADVTPAGD
jgi:hypothetical protein